MLKRLDYHKDYYLHNKTKLRKAHAVSKKHLHRYISEFEFRWNTRKIDDGKRVATAIKGAEGKRLMYREPTKKSKSAHLLRSGQGFGSGHFIIVVE